MLFVSDEDWFSFKLYPKLLEIKRSRVNKN